MPVNDLIHVTKKLRATFTVLVFFFFCSQRLALVNFWNAVMNRLADMKHFLGRKASLTCIQAQQQPKCEDMFYRPEWLNLQNGPWYFSPCVWWQSEYCWCRYSAQRERDQMSYYMVLLALLKRRRHLYIHETALSTKLFLCNLCWIFFFKCKHRFGTNDTP